MSSSLPQIPFAPYFFSCHFFSLYVSVLLLFLVMFSIIEYFFEYARSRTVLAAVRRLTVPRPFSKSRSPFGFIPHSLTRPFSFLLPSENLREELNEDRFFPHRGCKLGTDNHGVQMHKEVSPSALKAPPHNPPPSPPLFHVSKVIRKRIWGATHMGRRRQWGPCTATSPRPSQGPPAVGK